jgi:uncharacterized damage-inducible protein DinB
VNRDDFQLLYEFNSWANKRTLDSCIPLGQEQFTLDLKSSFNSVRDTLVHIVAAEWIWLERWHGRTPSSFPKAADYPDLDSVRHYASKIDRDLIDFVSSLNQEDLQRVISYKRFTGEAFAQPLSELLQHLANHSTYHRGQIATLLRQLGAEPISTDLLIFYRERSTAALA